MSKEYVLDTSAVRSLSASFIQQMNGQQRLTISPLSVYEILSHLDERSKKHGDESFAYRKSHVLKCKYLIVRDDPFAEQAAAVGAAAAVHPSRFEEKSVLPLIYPALEKSETLADFYESELVDSNSRTRIIRDVAERTRTVLEEEENKYIAFVNKLHKDIIDSMSFDEALALGGKEFVSFIVGAARSLQRHYEDEGIKVQDAMVFNAVCLHIGYVLTRLKLYMKKAGKGKSINVETNDMEDASILLHLDLSKPLVLVTNDGGGNNLGTIHALNETMAQLQKASAEIGDEIRVIPQVMTVDQFKSAVAPSTG